jgi:hypothetical protein
MRTASTVICEITSSKRATTPAARKAVPRLTPSQGSRFPTDQRIGHTAFSSPPAPNIFWMSA